MKFFRIITILLFIGIGTALAQSSKESLRLHINTGDMEAALQEIPSVLNQNPNDFDVLMMAGDVYLDYNRYSDAIKMYDRASRENRKSSEARLKLAKSQSLSGDVKNALETINDAIKRDEKDLSLTLELANIYLRADSLSQAELIITRAREMDKKSPLPYIGLGDLYFKQKVYELARVNYEEALAIEPNNIAAREKLATSYFWLANREMDDELSSVLFTRSLEEWNKVTQQDPNNARAFYEQGRIFYMANQHSNAANALSKYVQLRPSSSEARWLLAQSFEKVQRYDSAMYHLEIVVKEIDSVKLQASILLARGYFDMTDYQKAITTFESIDKDTTMSVLDFQRWGQAYLLLQDTVNALAIWDRTAKANPTENCKVMDQMGYIYQRILKYQEAIDILKLRLTYAECNDDRENIVHYLIGQSYLLSERPAEAIEPLRKSIELDSTFLFARLSLADALASSQDFDNATIEFEKLIELGRQDTAKNNFALVQGFNKLAGMYMEQKKFNDVIKVGERWATVFENESYPYLYIAIAHHNLGNGKSACTNYRKVLKIDPKNQSASKNLKLLQDSGGCDN
ncbi:MAG: tetratricopeptide repeat protein [Candidatus Kapabacteria bacterium]|nr:tetratricopeptide repeat protein [Candidatus Kapabacteria bacterium]